MRAEVLERISERLMHLAESAESFFSETTTPLWIEATARVAATIETEPPPGVASIEATLSLSSAAVDVQSEAAALLNYFSPFRSWRISMLTPGLGLRIVSAHGSLAEMRTTSCRCRI